MNQKVIDSFDRAAPDYHAASSVQRKIAGHLARTLFLEASTPDSIWEIGCGTGNLTRLLADQWPDCSLLITDASPSMLEVAKNKMIEFDQGRLKFETFVGGNDQPDGSYSMIASNMTLQWVDDLSALIHGLGRCTRTIGFSIPVDGSFENWIEAHRNCGIDSGIRDLIPLSRLKEELDTPGCETVFFEVRDIPARFERPLDFARSLKKTGTAVPRAGHRPVNLRRVVAGLPDNLEINYRVAFAVINCRS